MCPPRIRAESFCLSHPLQVRREVKSEFCLPDRREGTVRRVENCKFATFVQELKGISLGKKLAASQNKELFVRALI